MATYVLRLFVTGKTTRSEQAIANLRRVCEEEFPGQYQLVVIDTLEHPDIAERDKIFATPTLIKELPPPIRRIIGSLADRDRVLAGMGLHRI